MPDLRDAVRALRATPLVTAIAVLSLALGIGANTAIFSIVDALLLRPLPVRHAERLALLTTGDSWRGASWSNPIWESLRDRPGLHDGAFAYSTNGFDLAERGVTDPVDGLRASGAMFEVLGVEAQLGRTFTPADDRRDGGPDGPVAVISHGFWQRRYGGAADVLGRTIALSGTPYTIIGVMPRGFHGPQVGRTFDVAIPLQTVAILNGDAGVLDSRSSWWLRVMLRLAPGETVEQAAARLRAVQPLIADATRPADVTAEEGAAHLAQPFVLEPARAGASPLRGSYRRPVLALMGIVALTLLVACGNIANLLLARATARRHELSVRVALGASGARIARQLLAESLLLSAAGAALGAIVAHWGSAFVVSQIAGAAGGIYLDVGLDWRMLAFTAAVAVGTALLFGTLPALRAARVAPIEAMREQGRGSAGGRAVGVAGSLVTLQVAVSLVLLVGAGLLGRSFGALATLDAGFERDRALLVHVGGAGAGGDSLARHLVQARLQDAALAVPGVSHAALSVVTPVSGSRWMRQIELVGGAELAEADRAVHLNLVSPGWFAALGTPLVAGRDFDARDRPGAPRAVVVNRAFAAKYFGAANPIGQRIRERPRPGANPEPLTVIGVAGDAAYGSLREPAPPTMYWALPQMPQPPVGVSLVARAARGAPGALERPLTAALLAVHPELRLVVRPLADDVDASIAQERLVAALAGAFGVLALLLAALGLYGVTAHAVGQRRLELGIRMALGTTPAGVMRLVLRRVALLLGGGVLLGALAAWWAAQYVAALLHGLAPHDPATFGAAVAVLAGVAAVAGWLPATRAARIDPARVLREG